METSMTVTVRLGTADDLPFLREMLFEAAYWRTDWGLNQERPSLDEGLSRPDLAYLLEDWGRKGDTAFVAITNNQQSVGGAWYRFWGPEQHSYGYIAANIPELAIGVRFECRRMGIGHLLLDALLRMAASHGIEQISLSVEVENPALHLYLKHGFKAVQQNKGDWVMVANTKRTK